MAFWRRIAFPRVNGGAPVATPQMLPPCADASRVALQRLEDALAEHRRRGRRSLEVPLWAFRADRWSTILCCQSEFMYM